MTQKRWNQLPDINQHFFIYLLNITKKYSTHYTLHKKYTHNDIMNIYVSYKSQCPIDVALSMAYTWSYIGLSISNYYSDD